jgi:Domain of unknown function (DUF4760)
VERRPVLLADPVGTLALAMSAVLLLHNVADHAGFDWPGWLTAIFTVAIAAAAWVALRSLGDARRTRHGMLIADLSRRWDERVLSESVALWSSHTDEQILALVEKVYVTESATEAEADLVVKLSAVPQLLETIGVLVADGVLEADVVYQMWGATIIGAWDTWREPIDRIRASERRPWAYEHFQELAMKMRDREARRWRANRAASGRAGRAYRSVAAADGRTARPSSASPSDSHASAFPHSSVSANRRTFRILFVTYALLSVLRILLRYRSKRGERA